MTLEAITFWALGALLLASALMVVLTKNLFHSVLYLALSLTVTAGIFLPSTRSFSQRSSSSSTRGASSPSWSSPSW